MPDSNFLETYPLFRKFEMDLAEVPNVASLPKPSIHMYCEECESDQTFNLMNRNYDNYLSQTRTVKNSVVAALYRCSSCNNFIRYFLFKIDSNAQRVWKVGQYPPWSITLDSTLEKMLGNHSDYYKKGLISEYQGYGIGAFAYYRRIVEEIIDKLLTEIADLMTGEEQKNYLEAIEKVKQTRVTQEKIEIVKELLPSILRPNGMNPLSLLHGLLSEGLHGKQDEECIEVAVAIREVLVFLVNEVSVRKATAKNFTENMQKLLDRRSKS